MDLDNKIKAATLLVLIIGALGVVGTVIMTDKYQQLNTKYHGIVEWENGAYGRVTWVQDTDENKAALAIEMMSMRNLTSSPKGSQYLTCLSKSGEAGRVGICFYDPTARYRDK